MSKVRRLKIFATQQRSQRVPSDQLGEEILFFVKRFKIGTWEFGLLFRDGEFKGLVEPGTHSDFDWLGKIRVDIASQREPGLTHEKLDVIVKSGVLTGRAVVLDLKDHERALVWIENRFGHVVPAGLFAYWTGQKNVRVAIGDARDVQFEHQELKVIARMPDSKTTVANDCRRSTEEQVAVF